jgi:hypothetical protein
MVRQTKREKTMKKDFTREQWLNAAAELLGDKVFQPVGFDIPSDVKVS